MICRYIPIEQLQVIVQSIEKSAKSQLAKAILAAHKNQSKGNKYEVIYLDFLTILIEESQHQISIRVFDAADHLSHEAVLQKEKKDVPTVVVKDLQDTRPIISRFNLIDAISSRKNFMKNNYQNFIEHLNQIEHFIAHSSPVEQKIDINKLFNTRFFTNVQEDLCRPHLYIMTPDKLHVQFCFGYHNCKDSVRRYGYLIMVFSYLGLKGIFYDAEGCECSTGKLKGRYNVNY